MPATPTTPRPRAPGDAAAASARPAAGPGPGRSRAGLLPALAGTAIALATVAFGLIASETGPALGTELPPFFATWSPEIGPDALAWLTLAVAAAALAVLPARGSGPPLLFLVAVPVLALACRLAVAAAREGSDGWFEVFGNDPEAASEYLPALPALDLGTRTFLDRFAEIAPSLPIHPSAHPPGLLLLLDGLGIDSAEGMAALVIGAGIAAIPLTYWAARRLDFGDGRARIAATLLAFSPAAMLYGVSSADALFMTLGIAAVALLIAGGVASRLAGAVALAAASFFSWALLAAGAFAAVVIAIREGVGRAVAVAAGCGLVLLASYGALHAATGYDPLGVLAAANEAYRLGISNARPWLYWVFGSPVAFFVMAGLPISWYWLRSLGSASAPGLALAAIVAVSALAGFSKAETERIWLFMAPLACLAAAAVIPRERLPLVVALLVGQAIAVELTLETVW